MTAPEYALWDVCRSLSHHSGILYFNGRNVAARFKGMGKTGAYNLAASLTESGWFKLLKECARRQDGTFSPRQYKVLSHDEWVAEHPNQCEVTSPQYGQDEDGPVPIGDRPVRSEGHILITTTDKKQPEKQPDYHKPVRSRGLDKLKATLGGKASSIAAAPTGTGRPVRSEGQDVLNAHHEAGRLSNAITNTLDVKQPDIRLAWTTGVRSLLDSGHSPEKVLAVAEFAHTNLKPGTMQSEGPTGFVQHFDLLADAAMQRQEVGI